jgi:YbbR-like protein
VSLRAALTADLPLKLTSLALALFLWFLAAGEEPVSALLPVDLAVQAPVGRTLLHPPPVVRALVVGPRRELLKLGAASVRITRVLPDSVAGDEVRVDLSPGEVELPRGITARVQDVEPRAVTVALDATEQRVVPVHPVVRISGAAGYTVGRIVVVPGTVRLLGPADRIGGIDSLATEPLEVTGAEGPVEQSLALDTGGLGPAVRLEPARATVRVEVEPLHERTFGAVPVRLPSRAAAAWAPALDSVTVRVRGRAGRLATLEADSVVVLAEWSGARPPGRVALRVVLPPGVSGRAEPDSVDIVSRRTNG